MPKNADRLMFARAVKRARKHLKEQSDTVTLTLTRAEAKWLLERLAGPGVDDAALNLRAQLVEQAFR